MNISSHQGEVVFTEDGEIHHPINVDIVSATIKCLGCSIGIPLNLFIAFTIIKFRRIRRKSRNIFLLGIILSYLSFFIPTAIELIYWGLYPIESVCHAYIAVVAVPQGLLLANMLLALTERYLAINYPLLHRREMTNRLAGGLIMTISIVTIFLIKFVYIARLGTLRCEVWLVHVKVHASLLIILFTSCLVLNVIIYRQTKTLLRDSRTLQTPQGERDLSSASAIVNNQSTAVTPMCIHADRDKLNEMEMEASRTLVIGVASLCVMPCLALIFIASFFACRLVCGQLECSYFVRIMPIIKELSLSPAVYGPIIFIVRNKELRAAWACPID
jgi:dopamine receptor D1